MNYKRIGRMLICLLLVCVFVINTSPIRAEAVSLGVLVGATAGVVATSIAIPAILNALGIAPGTTGEVFDDFSSSLQGFVSDWIVDGGLPIYALSTGGVTRTYFPVEIIHTILETILGTDIIVTSFGGPYYQNFLWMGATQEYETYNPRQGMVCGIATYLENGRWKSRPVAICQNPGGIKVGSSGTERELTAVGGYYAYISTSEYSHSTQPTNSTNLLWKSNSESAADIVASCPYLTVSTTTPYDLTLEDFQTDITKHSSFMENFVVDDEGYPYVPITIPSATTVVNNQAQKDAQTGLTSAEVLDVVFGVGFEDGTDPSEPDTGEGKFYPMDPNYSSLVERLFGNVSDKIEYVAHSIQEIPDLIREFALDVKKCFEELPTKFAEWFNDIRTKLQQLVNGQITLADLLSGLFQPIRNAVVDALTYLFAPSETFIQNQVETLIAKYPTAATFSELGHSFRGFFDGLGVQPPIIYIDLGSAEGDYVYGGRMAFIDLTWYARYKPTVDTILGAFIWLWVAWRFFVSIPGIISGAPGIFGSPNEKPDIEIRVPRFEVGKNWLNSGSSYHKKGDGGGV